MRYDRTPAARLSTSQREAWAALRRDHPTLGSPLLSPQLFEHVARSRSGLELLTASAGGEIVALLPLHVRQHVGTPYAGPLADVQGLIAGRFSPLHLREMMRATGLSAIHFNAQLAGQAALASHVWKLRDAPYIELPDGFESYCDSLRRRGCNDLKETLRKGRKLEREVGPLRLELSDNDDRVLTQLLRWKAEQLRRQRQYNSLQLDWVRQTLQGLPQLATDDCQGMVSALWVGDALAAGAAMLVSGGVAHGWVLSFNPDFARFSPGMLLLLRWLEAAADQGLRRLEMGVGQEPFKQRFQTGADALGEGSVDRLPLRRMVRRQLTGLRDWLGESAVRRWARDWLNRRRYA